MTRTIKKIISLVLAITLFIACDNNSREIHSKNEKTKSLIAPELHKAQEYLRRQMYHNALQIADSLIAVSPDIPELHYLKGKIFFQLKQYEKSKSAFHHVMALDDDFQSVHYQLGNIAFTKENYNEALAQYTIEEAQLLNAGQNDLHALSAIWIQIGRCHDRLGNTDQAINFFNKVLVRDSTNAEALADLGQLYKNNGEFREAQKYYKKALQYDSANTEYQYFYGYLLLNAGETERAVQLFNSILEEKPWDYSTHYHLGRSLLQLGSQEAAEMHMAIADSLQDIDYNIATAEWTVEVYEEAIARYKDILQIDPSSEIIWFNLGLVYAKLDDRQNARIAMQQSLKLNPDFELAKRYISAFDNR